MIPRLPYKKNTIKLPYEILPLTTNETNSLKPADIWTYALLSYSQGDSSFTIIDFPSFSELLGLDISETANSMKKLISQGWVRQNLNGGFSCALTQIPEEKRERIPEDE